MKRIKLEQGSLEWLEHRYGKIGGTLSKGLLIKSDTLKIELLSQILEDYEPEESFVSKDMERGNELEPYARKELNKYTGLDFKEIGWLQSSECDLIGISPDGLTDDDKNSCELKCPARKKHTETILIGEIPSDNIDQCIHYFTVNPKLENHYFASFRPENKIKPLFVKKLTRTSEINIGTKARPVLKTIQEVVDMSLKAAKQMEIDLSIDLEKIKF